MRKLMRTMVAAAGWLLLLPGTALAQASPSPTPAGEVPMDNPGASVGGLPFSGSLHDLTMWVTGLGFVVCLVVFLAGSGMLKPLGHLFGHQQTAVRGMMSQISALLGALSLGAGFIIVAFFWHVGVGVH